MAYITLAEWKQYRSQLSGGVESNYTTQEDAVLQTFIDQAQAEIEAQCGKRFESATATGYFSAVNIAWDNPRLLLLGEWLLTITTLTNGDGNAISASNYWLWPRGSGPFCGVLLKNAASWSFAVDGEITIAGTWGFTATANAQVKRVTYRLAEFFWQKRTTTGESSIVGTDQILVAAQYPKDVQDFIMSQRMRQVA